MDYPLKTSERITPLLHCVLLNQRSFFDKIGEERVRKFGQFAPMKNQPVNIHQLPVPLPEAGRIYLAIIAGGAAILLMILAEMKFFGT